MDQNGSWEELFEKGTSTLQVDWFVLRGGQGFRSRYQNGFIRSAPAVLCLTGGPTVKVRQVVEQPRVPMDFAVAAYWNQRTLGPLTCPPLKTNQVYLISAEEFFVVLFRWKCARCLGAFPLSEEPANPTVYHHLSWMSRYSIGWADKKNQSQKWSLRMSWGVLAIFCHNWLMKLLFHNCMARLPLTVIVTHNRSLFGTLASTSLSFNWTRKWSLLGNIVVSHFFQCSVQCNSHYNNYLCFTLPGHGKTYQSVRKKIKNQQKVNHTSM